MRPLKAFLISTLLLMSACTEIVQPRTPLSLPNPEPLTLRPVRWTVIPMTDDDGRAIVFFSLSESGYKNLSLNVQDILTYMQIQREILENYREYYEPELQNSELQ